MLGYHQLHHTFVVQVVSHIDEHLVYKGFPACYDFQSLAIGIEIILLAVVDGYRYVRISAKVFLQDIIVMGIERLAVHDGLQVFTDVIKPLASYFEGAPGSHAEDTVALQARRCSSRSWQALTGRR